MPCLLIQVQRYGRAQKTKDQGTHLVDGYFYVSVLLSLLTYIHLWHNPSPSTPPPGPTFFYITLPSLRLPCLAGLTSPLLLPPSLYLDLFRGAPSCIVFFDPIRRSATTSHPSSFPSSIATSSTWRGFFLYFPHLLCCRRMKEAKPATVVTDIIAATSLVQPFTQPPPPPRTCWLG
ncbi:hypothetical protein LX36DRAFT_349183 [Colletotrichum falcatum]|nr:hypothetical protein LX36DRAFT_349183 [Colletotrichum falcatum]